MLKPRSDIRLDPKHAAFAYQMQAVEAVKSLPYAALFHEQGLGKTKIGIDLGLEWLTAGQVDTVLVVTKRSLVQNWSEEIRAHTHLVARVIDQNHASNFYALNSPARFYLAHYEVFKTEEKRLAVFLKTRRVGVILDESHKIKNPDAEITKAFHRLSDLFARRVIMTGTPVANRPYDLWSQIFFLDKGEALGTDFSSFRTELDLRNDLWADEGRRQRFEDKLSSVFAKIEPFTVRETKDTAGIQLPEKKIENILVPLESEQRRLYESYQAELRADIVRDGVLIEDDAEDILKRLLRLVQIASNPALVDHSYSATPGKVPTLINLVERAVRENTKIIIWTNFIENASWLSEQLSTYGSVCVHGSRTIEDRNAAIKSFKTDPAVRLLVATPGAAKEGLTLTMASHAVFYDRSFSLDDYLQAQDRIHRISQKNTCHVWNLIAADSVDEWVDSLLTAKRLAAQLAQSDISPEDYQRLANYDFGRIIRNVLGLE